MQGSLTRGSLRSDHGWGRGERRGETLMGQGGSGADDTGRSTGDTFERYVAQPFEENILKAKQDFRDPKQEWRRLFSEALGTFFLVLVAAGGGMMSQAFPNTISRTAAVTAPGLMVMAIILFMGKVSGAHLNPAVSLAFAARGDFPWRRVPGYIVVQLLGRDPRGVVPPGGHQRVRNLWLELPGVRVRGVAGLLDGVHPDSRTGERDPRHGIRGPKHRHLRCDRRRRLHRVGRACGAAPSREPR